MDIKDFPNYYQASDYISIKSQKYYLNIIKFNLIAMIFAALLAFFSSQVVEYNCCISSLTLLILLIGLILTIILKSKKYEDLWYQGRALAESCKTLTWRFAMCAEYFENELTNDDVQERFVERIKVVLSEFNDLSKIIINSKILNKEIITNKMIELRKLSTTERKKYYLENRIKNQQEWYSNKADWNKRKYDLWFWIIILTQSLAIISIIILIINPNNTWNIVGFFTTIVSSAFCWMQIKKHQEQKQAYKIASKELSFIKELSYDISSEKQLSAFVQDSENAISREHTVWLAQRRK